MTDLRWGLKCVCLTLFHPSGVTNYPGKTRNGNILPDSAKLCKTLHSRDHKNRGAPLNLCNSSKTKKKKKQHSIPCFRLPPLVFSIDAWET